MPRGVDDPSDFDVEYEPEATVCALEAAVRQLGHEPLRLGSARALLARLGKGELPPLDVALSIAEGRGTRNREAWAPILFELAGVPTLGSDALTLSLCLDKAWSAALVAQAGVPAADPHVVRSAQQAAALAPRLAYPVFVNPRWEGTAMGIRPSSRVEQPEALGAEVIRILDDYRQPALVERFLPGPEYTVTVFGHDPPRVLPVLQRALEPTTGIGYHAVERHPGPPGGWRFEVPGTLDATLEKELARLALRACETLECRDFGRADFRLDARGEPHFLELNPLPTFAPDGSFGVLAELADRSLEDLLADVFGAALTRLGLT
jgi:D-alanine-D-alanine ligase